MRWTRVSIVLVLVMTAIPFVGDRSFQAENAATDIPGITGVDVAPRGCVDCHRPASEDGPDTRLSAQILRWFRDGAPAEMIAAARASWPNALVTGAHPFGSEMLSQQVCNSCHPGRTPEQPSTCLFCHDASTERPLGPLVHTIHYSLSPQVTGERADFVTAYGGFCTHCHALDAGTGRMLLKRGSEELPE